MAEIVYILCAATSFTCTVLLIRSYHRTHARLLLWSSVCFACLTLSNTALFVDLIVLPNIDLLVFRTGITLIGLMALLYGLIWETS